MCEVSPLSHGKGAGGGGRGREGVRGSYGPLGTWGVSATPRVSGSLGTFGITHACLLLAARLLATASPARVRAGCDHAGLHPTLPLWEKETTTVDLLSGAAGRQMMYKRSRHAKE